jgi:chemotaxis protein MotA
MDLATLIGLVAGLALVFGAIFVGGGAGGFFDIPSLMITVGGSFSALLINFPLNRVLGVFSVVKNCFTHQLPSPVEVVKTLVELATICRRDGPLALEARIEQIPDSFLAKGVQLVVDGASAEVLREILEIEISYLEERHATGKKILEALGTAAPAFGLIGTLIGLVQMLRSLDDPSRLGPAMAVALLTTFYGTILANLLCIPLAGKLETRSKEEVLVRELMVEGLVSITQGHSPRLIEEKLKAFLSPRLRGQPA